MRILRKRDDDSFKVIERTNPCLDDLWHCHSQYELILITQSSGIRFVGDNVAKFLSGDLVLVGPNLPHLWRNDISGFCEEDEEIPSVKTIIVKFEPDFLGEDFFNTPEFQEIRSLLDDSARGMHFENIEETDLMRNIIALTEKKGAECVISFLDILHQLSHFKNRQVLSASNMANTFEDKKNRQDDILKFISDNYSNEISLEEISSIACMTPNSFCRYFKNLTKKPFSVFLNEVRIQNAVRLISLNNENIKNISYDVGYKSVTNFNRQFKKVMKKTPMQYKQSLKVKPSFN